MGSVPVIFLFKTFPVSPWIPVTYWSVTPAVSSWGRLKYRVTTKRSQLFLMLESGAFLWGEKKFKGKGLKW